MNPEELLRKRLARNRYMQIQQALKKQKLLDTAPRAAQYQGFQVDGGGIIDLLGGGNLIVPPITNGLMLPSQEVSLRRGICDSMPHTNNLQEENQEIKQIFDLGILYTVREIPTKDMHCTCGCWNFVNCRCRELCNLEGYANFSDVYACHTEQECIEACPLLYLHENYIYPGYANAQNQTISSSKSCTFKFNYSNAHSVSLYTTFSIRLLVRPFIVKNDQRLTVRIDANTSLIPKEQEVWTNITLNSITDYRVPSHNISYIKAFEPGTSAAFEYYYFVAVGDGTMFEDVPASGTITCSIELEEKPTPIRIYYFQRNSNPNQKIKLFEAREDDPCIPYLTCSGAISTLSVKRGIDYFFQNQVSWQKIYRYKINSGKANEEIFSHPVLPSQIPEWQSDFINYRLDSYRLLETYNQTSDLCIERFVDNQSNLIKSKFLHLDLNQEINGDTLREKIKLSALKAALKIIIASPQANICTIKSEKIKPIKVHPLALTDEEKQRTEDIQLVAVSPWTNKI